MKSKAIEKIKKSYTIRYVVALSLIALSTLFSHLLIQEDLLEQAGHAGMINKAGRQRMLSQRITKLVLIQQHNLLKGIFEDEFENDHLSKSLSDFKSAHEFLRSQNKEANLSNLNSEEIRHYYNLTQPFFSTLVNAAEITLKGQYFKADNHFIEASEEYLDLMNRIVISYEKRSFHSAEKIRSIEHMILIFTLSLLVVEAVFIFKPAVKMIEENYRSAMRERAVNVANSGLVEVGRMQGTMVHEIKNILSIISMGAQHVLKIDDKEKMKKSSFMILKNTERCLRVIENVRSLSRKEKVELRLVSTTEITETLQEMIPVDAKIPLKINDSYKSNLLCNKMALIQVLLNLYRNSVDAIKEDEESWVQLFIQNKANEVVMELTDSGGGIPEDITKKMFNPFYTTKVDSEGTGIGLDVCKDIVEGQHQGQIYYNKKSMNTQFVIRLPIKKQNSWERAA